MSDNIIVYDSPADKVIKETAWSIFSDHPILVIFFFLTVIVVGTILKENRGSSWSVGVKKNKIKIPPRRPYRRPPTKK